MLGRKHEIPDLDGLGRANSRLSGIRPEIDILDFVFAPGNGHHGRVTDRAVAVSLHDDQVLVIRRHRDGRDYCVLPGGGVEADEQPQQAVVRELLEETGLNGTVERHLWTLEHSDRVAHYFLLQVVPGPMTVSGPEALIQSDRNSYRPEWIQLDDLAANNLQPEEIRQLLNDLTQPSAP